MAAQGLYDDGKKGIRRLTDPDLRLKDQDRDGIQAEVLYGILGATSRINDDQAAGEMLRIYNEWLAGFCNTHFWKGGEPPTCRVPLTSRAKTCAALTTPGQAAGL